MNPTSPGKRSPGRPIPPNISLSAQIHELGNASLSDSTEWIVENECCFPVHSQKDNEDFKQQFDHLIEEISLQLKTVMAYLSELSPDEITTPWETLGALAYCLGNDLPKQLPLSIFTSTVVTTCIEALERSLPAKKSKISEPSKESEIRNKTYEASKKLAAIISSTILFLQNGIQLDKLKEKNHESLNVHRAFQCAIFQRFALGHAAVLDLPDQDLADRIISAIDPRGDKYSDDAKNQLTGSAARKFLKTQDAFVSQACNIAASKKKSVPFNGNTLFAIYTQQTTSSIKVSSNVEGLSSWEDLIFCFLARTFLEKKKRPHSRSKRLSGLIYFINPLPFCSQKIPFNSFFI